MTVILRGYVADPPELVAVIVYDVSATTALDVPVNLPSVVRRARPAGRVGETENEVGAPPEVVALFAAIAAPFTYVAGAEEYVSIVGATSLTVIVRENELDPPLFDAVMI